MSGAADRVNTLRVAYLRYIQAYIEGDDPNTKLLRTFVDTWFAYDQGGPFLTASLSARWFNKGDLAARPEAIKLFHFHSLKAWAVYEGHVPWEDLAKDHCLPLSELRAGLMKLRGSSLDDIESYLRDHYRIALITRVEHEALTERKLRSSSPSERFSGHTSRYQAAGIELRPSTTNPSPDLRRMSDLR